jgi:hypothetical protein
MKYITRNPNKLKASTMAPAKSKKVTLTLKDRPDTRAKRPSRGKTKEKYSHHQESGDQDAVDDSDARQAGEGRRRSQSLEVINGEGDAAQTGTNVDEIAAMRGKRELLIRISLSTHHLHVLLIAALEAERAQNAELRRRIDGLINKP